MNQKLKDKIKELQKTSPLINSLVMRMRFGKFFNSVKKDIHGKNNSISYKHAILSSVKINIYGNNNQIEIAQGAVLTNVVFNIYGNNHKVIIGQNCHFNKGSNIRIEDSYCSLSIGEYSSFEDVHFALTEPHSSIAIGKDCMFAQDIDIRTGDSHSIISKQSDERINHAENVSIGDQVWVASRCSILKGSTISSQSVVATGAIVTKKYYEKGILIGGIPAKKIKEGIYWTRNRIHKEFSSISNAPSKSMA